MAESSQNQSRIVGDQSKMRSLYEQLNRKVPEYDWGSEEEFMEGMQDEQNREWLHKTLTEKGKYKSSLDHFNNRLGFGMINLDPDSETGTGPVQYKEPQYSQTQVQPQQYETANAGKQYQAPAQDNMLPRVPQYPMAGMPQQQMPMYEGYQPQQAIQYQQAQPQQPIQTAAPLTEEAGAERGAKIRKSMDEKAQHKQAMYDINKAYGINDELKKMDDQYQQQVDALKQEEGTQMAKDEELKHMQMQQLRQSQAAASYVYELAKDRNKVMLPYTVRAGFTDTNDDLAKYMNLSDDDVASYARMAYGITGKMDADMLAGKRAELQNMLAGQVLDDIVKTRSNILSNDKTAFISQKFRSSLMPDQLFSAAISWFGSDGQRMWRNIENEALAKAENKYDNSTWGGLVTYGAAGAALAYNMMMLGKVMNAGFAGSLGRFSQYGPQAASGLWAPGQAGLRYAVWDSMVNNAYWNGALRGSAALANQYVGFGRLGAINSGIAMLSDPNLINRYGNLTSVSGWLGELGCDAKKMIDAYAEEGYTGAKFGLVNMVTSGIATKVKSGIFDNAVKEGKGVYEASSIANHSKRVLGTKALGLVGELGFFTMQDIDRINEENRNNPDGQIGICDYEKWSSVILKQVGFLGALKAVNMSHGHQKDKYQMMEEIGRKRAGMAQEMLDHTKMAKWMLERTKLTLNANDLDELAAAGLGRHKEFSFDLLNNLMHRADGENITVYEKLMREKSLPTTTLYKLKVAMEHDISVMGYTCDNNGRIVASFSPIDFVTSAVMCPSPRNGGGWRVSSIGRNSEVVEYKTFSSKDDAEYYAGQVNKLAKVNSMRLLETELGDTQTTVKDVLNSYADRNGIGRWDAVELYNEWLNNRENASPLAKEMASEVKDEIWQAVSRNRVQAIAKARQQVKDITGVDVSAIVSKDPSTLSKDELDAIDTYNRALWTIKKTATTDPDILAVENSVDPDTGMVRSGVTKDGRQVTVKGSGDAVVVTEKANPAEGKPAGKPEMVSAKDVQITSETPADDLIKEINDRKAAEAQAEQQEQQPKTVAEEPVPAPASEEPVPAPEPVKSVEPEAPADVAQEPVEEPAEKIRKVSVFDANTGNEYDGEDVGPGMQAGMRRVRLGNGKMMDVPAEDLTYMAEEPKAAAPAIAEQPMTVADGVAPVVPEPAPVDEAHVSESGVKLDANTGMPTMENAPENTAAYFATNESKLGEKMNDAVIKQATDRANAAYQAAMKKTPNLGTDMNLRRMQQEQAAIEAEQSRLKQQADYWNAVSEAYQAAKMQAKMKADNEKYMTSREDQIKGRALNKRIEKVVGEIGDPSTVREAVLMDFLKPGGFGLSKDDVIKELGSIGENLTAEGLRNQMAKGERKKLDLTIQSIAEGIASEHGWDVQEVRDEIIDVLTRFGGDKVKAVQELEHIADIISGRKGQYTDEQAEQMRQQALADGEDLNAPIEAEAVPEELQPSNEQAPFDIEDRVFDIEKGEGKVPELEGVNGMADKRVVDRAIRKVANDNTLSTEEKAERIDAIRKRWYAIEDERISKAAEACGVDGKFMKRLGNATGSKVVADERFFDYDTENGFYDADTDTIYVNPRGNKMGNLSGILGHETTHGLEGTKGYDELSDVLIELEYGQDGDVSEAIREIQDRYNNHFQNMYELGYHKSLRHLYWEGAKKEVVANVLKNSVFKGAEGAKMLEQAVERMEDQSMAGRFAAKVRDMYDLAQTAWNKGWDEAVSKKELMDARDKFADLAKKRRAENDKNAMQTRVIYDDHGKVIAEVDERNNIQMNLETYDSWRDNLNRPHDGTRKTMEAYLDEKIKTGLMKPEDKQQMLEKMDYWYDYMRKVSDFVDPETGEFKFKAFHEWNAQQPVYRLIGKGVEEKVLSTIVANGEYPVNLELTTDCIKRETFTQLLNEIVRLAPGALQKLNPGEITILQDMMKSYGIQTACPLCFVEGKRLMIRNWAQTISDNWNVALAEAVAENDLLNGWKPKFKTVTEVVEGKKKTRKVVTNLKEMEELLGAFGFASDDAVSAEDWDTVKSRNDVSEQQEFQRRVNSVFDILAGRRGGLLDADMQDIEAASRRAQDRMMEMERNWMMEHVDEPWEMSKAEREEIDGILADGKKVVHDKMKINVSQYPELRKVLHPEDLIGNKGLDNLRSLGDEAHRKLFSNILSSFGAGTPKVVQRAEPYAGEIMDRSMDSAVNKAVKEGGWRLFSFSDYDISKTFDIMQIFWDAEARMAKLQSYSKEVPYILFFGRGTNAKINMSTLVEVRPDAAVIERYKKAPNKSSVAGKETKETIRHEVNEYAGLVLNKEGEIIGNNWEDGRTVTKNTGKEGEIIGMTWSNSHSVSPEFAQAIFHDDEYNANCGATTVGVSVNHTLYSMMTPWIRQVIPFHLSGMPIAARNRTDVLWYRDFTSDQNTCVQNDKGKWVKITSDWAEEHLGKMKEFNFYEGEEKEGWDLRKRCEDYVKWCNKNKFRPKFEWALNADNYVKWCKENGYEPNKQIETEMRAHETNGIYDNYYKVIADFNPYKPTFDAEGNYTGDVKAPHKPIKGDFTKDQGLLDLMFGAEDSMLANREANIEHGNAMITKMANDAIAFLQGKKTREEIMSKDPDAFRNTEDADLYLRRRRQQWDIEDAEPAGPVRSRNFKRWFGNWDSDPENASKVVDEKGRPLVVYHGTPRDFDEFDIKMLGTNSGNNGYFGEGFYLTSKLGTGEFYARGQNGRVMKLYVNIRNPFDVSKLFEIDGVKYFNRGFGNPAYILNMVEKFPELLKDVKIDVLHDDDTEETTGVFAYGKILKKLASEKDLFEIEDNGEYITARANREDKEQTNHLGKTTKWTDYGFERQYPKDTPLLQIASDYLAIHGYRGLRMNALYAERQMSPMNLNGFTDAVKTKGHDGIISDPSFEEIVAFEPEQIKSADGNNGDYDQSKRNIYYDVEPEGSAGDTVENLAISKAESETDINPTDAQKIAGNYKKGHVKLDGYDITIETPKGAERRGKDKYGKEWRVTMNNTYGYIRGTEGVDGDQIDVFLSGNPEGRKVYVVDQVNDDGSFDEHKVMYGFDSEKDAREAYLSNYSEGWNGLGKITEVSKKDFRKWIESSYRKTKPFTDYKIANGRSYVSDKDINEISRMKVTVHSWLNDEDLEWSEGKSIEEIIGKYGNDLSPVAYIPESDIDYFDPDLTDNRIYCGKAYFIDHAANHHPEISKEEYDLIQLIINNPDHRKLAGESVVYTKRLGKGYAVAVSLKKEDGKILLHKSFFWKKNSEPYKNKPEAEKKKPSEGSVSSISRKEISSPGSHLSALDGHGKDMENHSNTQENVEESSNIDEKTVENADFSNSRKQFDIEPEDMSDRNAAYKQAVESGDREKALEILQDEADKKLNRELLLPNDDDEEGFKYHRGPAPKKTFKRYAVLNVTPEGFKAAYAGNKTGTPVGVWIDAQNLQSYLSDMVQFDDGTFASYVPGDTGDRTSNKFSAERMKELGLKGGQKWLLERGGKHSSDVPNFSQMNLKRNEAGEKVSSGNDGALPHNKLIFEIEYGIDENGDLTDYVKENGRMIKGRNQGLAKIEPNQYYDFKTNPNAVGNWGIGGTFRITRLVPHDEIVEKTEQYKRDAVTEANRLYAAGKITKKDRDARVKNANSIKVQQWVGGYHPEEFGLSEESVAKMAEEGRRMKMMDITYDDNGELIPLSERFDMDKMDARYDIEPDDMQPMTVDTGGAGADDMPEDFVQDAEETRFRKYRELVDAIEKEAANYQRELDWIKNGGNDKGLLTRVRHFVRNRLNLMTGTGLGPAGINNILSQLDQVGEAQDIEPILRQIQYTLNRAELKSEMDEMLRVLNTKTQSQTSRGLVKGIGVDSQTNQVLSDIRGSFRQMVTTDIDERIREVNREIRDLKKEYGIKHVEDGDAEFQAKYREMRDRYTSLLEQRNEAQKAQANETEETLTERHEQILNEMNDYREQGKEIPSTLIEERVALPIRKELAQLRSMTGTMDQIEKELQDARDALIGLRGDERTNQKRLIEDKQANLINWQRRCVLMSKQISDELKDLISEGRSKRQEQIRKQVEEENQLVKIALDAVKKNRITQRNQPAGTKEHEDKEWTSADKMVASLQESWKENKEDRRDFMQKFNAPVYSFNYLLKYLDRNHGQGDGPLYDMLMRSEHGAVEANDAYAEGLVEYGTKVDKKCKEIFGMSLGDLKADSNKRTYKTIVLTEQLGDGTIIQKPVEVTKGQALYIWLMSRQIAGIDKLRDDGWTPDKIQEIEELMGDKYKKLGTWITEEFLPQLRADKYNPTYERLYGTSMHMASHYFPIKIWDKVIHEKGELGEHIEGMPSASTGNLVTRTTNNLPIDTDVNALDILMDYGRSMERWNAMSELTRKLNVLRHCNAFRNRIVANDGEGMWQIWLDACDVVTNNYQSMESNAFGQMMGKLQNSFMKNAIGYRWYTALKQTLSYPAFSAYTGDLGFQAELLANIGRTFTIGKKGSIWESNYQWAMENLPGFRQRIADGDMGIEGLNDDGIGGSIERYWSKYGMAANKAVDARTVAAGARAVYNYEYKQGKKRGLSDAEAKRLAKVNAEICFNESQQSSRPEFSSPMQKNRDLMSRSTVAFQNSNISYRRGVLEGMNDILRANEIYKQNMESVRGSDHEEEYKKQFSADRRKQVSRGVRKVLNFGALLPGLWYIGSNLSTLWANNEDDKEKDKYWINMMANIAMGSLTNGSSTGPAVQALYNSVYKVVTGDSQSATAEYNPLQSVSLLTEIMTDALKTYKEDVKTEGGIGITGWAEGMANWAFRFMGVNPETWANIVLGLMDTAKRGRPELQDAMFVLNVPGSHRKEIVNRMARKDSPAEYMRQIMEAGKIYEDGDTRYSQLMMGTKIIDDKKRHDLLQDYLNAKYPEFGVELDKINAFEKAVGERAKEIDNQLVLDGETKHSTLIRMEALNDVIESGKYDISAEAYKRIANSPLHKDDGRLDIWEEMTAQGRKLHRQTLKSKYDRLRKECDKAAANAEKDPETLNAKVKELMEVETKIMIELGK